MGLCFSPGGKLLAVSGIEIDNAMIKRFLKVWDTAAGKLKYQLDLGQRSINGAVPAFSPDSKRLAWGTFEGTVHVANAANGKEQLKIDTELRQVESVLFSPDGKKLVGRAMMDAGLGIWDAATGKELKTSGKPAPG